MTDNKPGWWQRLSRLLGARTVETAPDRTDLEHLREVERVRKALGGDLQLSPHFLLSELTHTDTRLPNEPSPEHVANLRLLCERVLEPWRERVGPLRISSGFRSEAVNTAVKGSRTSEHLQGLAADVVPVRTALPEAWAELVRLVEEGLPVSQGIVYQRVEGRGWIHCSVDLQPPVRKELLVQAGGRYHRWEDWGEQALVLPR